MITQAQRAHVWAQKDELFAQLPGATPDEVKRIKEEIEVLNGYLTKDEIPE